MSDSLVLYESQNGTVNELTHYGVLGMKWGVRRSPKQLRAKSGKLAKKNAKLDRKRVALEDKTTKRIGKKQEKIAKLHYKADKKRSKTYGLFTSRDKAQVLNYDAGKLDAKANKLQGKINAMKGKTSSIEAKIKRNKNLMNVYNATADALDSGKISKGKGFVDKFFMKYEDVRY